MKIKYLITMFFCIAFSAGSFAQTWPMPGAYWEYCVGNLYYLNFSYTHDTLINSTNYNVIEHTNPPSSSYDRGETYTRYSNDTVYRYVQSTEFPFLIFDASVGDVYTTFRTNSDVFADSSCRSILPVKILQFDTVNYSSLALKHWVLEDTLFNYIYTGGYPASIWDIAERIGFLNNFPFVANTIIFGNSCNIPTDMENGGYYLAYYSDSTFSYTAPWTCITGILDQDNAEGEFSVYPCPANDILNISFSKNETPLYFIIYNIWGDEVFRFYPTNSAMSVSIESLPLGFYFLKCVSKENSSAKSFLISR